MKETQLTYPGSVTRELEFLVGDNIEYPDSFTSDCNVCWIKKMSPAKAAANLAVHYGWDVDALEMSKRVRNYYSGKNK